MTSLYAALLTRLLARAPDPDEHRAARRLLHGIGADLRGGPRQSPARQVPAPRSLSACHGVASFDGQHMYLDVRTEVTLGELIRTVLVERIDGRHP